MIRLAAPNDFETLLEVREEVAIDLLQRGIPSNPNSLTRQHLVDWTSEGVLWVADLDGEVIGSIAVWFHDPTDYWPRADLASYVRDLMVHPRLRHQGYGALLLKWAERYSAGRGRNRVRLDCGNLRLGQADFFAPASQGALADREDVHDFAIGPS